MLARANFDARRLDCPLEQVLNRSNRGATTLSDFGVRDPAPRDAEGRVVIAKDLKVDAPHDRDAAHCQRARANWP